MSVLTRHAEAFPDLNPVRLDDRGLASRDAALMHAIYDTAVRRWNTIEWLVGVAASRRAAELEPFVRSALLAGASQVLFMDRIPDHAAIDRCVEWTKRARGKGAAGLVNAVLRRICAARASDPTGGRSHRPAWTVQRDELPLPDGRALVLSRKILPAEDRPRTGIATGIGPWLLDRWTQRVGATEARRLAWHSLAAAPVIVNATLAREPVPFPLAAGGALELRPHRAPGHFCVQGPRPALDRFLAERPDLWVQDPSSSAAIGSVGDLSPALVVDWCAGQGTKTRQLAATFPSARIIATDTDPARFATLEEQFRGSPQVSAVPPARARELSAGAADLVLVDVPCSNSGVLARRIEARHRAGGEQLARLGGIQAQILDDVVGLLSARGRVLYATCSLEPEENNLPVAGAAARHGLGVSRERSSVPCGGPGADASEHTDGSFSALLSR